MKIFAIRDAADQSNKDLAYLFYYEINRKFYIELPDGRKIAGEIDAIAVDKDGNSFVIDTKTSYK